MKIFHNFSGESVELKTYEGNAEGYIESVVDRFTSHKATTTLESFWNEDKIRFPSLLGAI